MTEVKLTPRERQVVDLVCEDRSYQSIARELGVRPRTVEVYVRAVAQRLPPATPGRGARAIRLFFGKLKVVAPPNPPAPD